MPMSADIAFMPRLSEFKTEKGGASIGAVNGACVCRACGPGDGRECFGQARASAAPVRRATSPNLWTGKSLARALAKNGVCRPVPHRREANEAAIDYTGGVPGVSWAKFARSRTTSPGRCHTWLPEHGERQGEPRPRGEQEPKRAFAH